MERWPNTLSPLFSPAQMIIFTENPHTGKNWTPPNITVVPVDEEAISKSSFGLTDLAMIPDFKRASVVRAINELNEKECRTGYQWVIAGVKSADTAVLLVVKVVQR
ncbi:hypothetical protein ABW19_dt0209609 [Dactylella cylindrospora]|nr:hypothetical protein ABW19_dt0209609 [Dactylella cylindrospora]